MNLVVSGYYGAVNVGDEAVCRAVVNGLRSRIPNCRIAVVTHCAKRSRNFGGIEADFLEGFYPSLVFWRNFPQYLRTLRRADLCIVGGGGIFQDVHSWKSSCRHLITASIATSLGKPVLAVGLGVGPLRSGCLRHLIGRITSCFVAIQVRDASSKQALLDCGVSSERISVTADVVPSLRIEEWPETEQTVADKPRRIGFAIRRWPNLCESGLMALWEKITDDQSEIWLLCYEPDSDRRFYKELLSKSSEKCRKYAHIHVPENLEDAVRTLACMDAVMAMRLHACVFSAALDIPFLCIPYDGKVTMFAEQMGRTDRLCPLEQVGPLCWDQLLEISNASVGPRGLPSDSFLCVRNKAMENFAVVNEAANSPPSSYQRLKAFSYAVLLLSLGLSSGLHELLCVYRRRAPGGHSTSGSGLAQNGLTEKV